MTFLKWLLHKNYHLTLIHLSKKKGAKSLGQTKMVLLLLHKINLELSIVVTVNFYCNFSKENLLIVLVAKASLVTLTLNVLWFL